MKVRSYSQKEDVNRFKTKPIIQEFVTFQKTSDHGPHRYIMQLIDDRVDFKESIEKKPKYSISLRNMGSVKCVESTLIVKHLSVSSATKWLETYIMLRSASISKNISKLLLESMVSNYFPSKVNFSTEGEDERNERKLVNRSLSQGNAPVNRAKRQSLPAAISPVNADKPGSDQEAPSANKSGPHSNPCSRTRTPIHRKTLSTRSLPAQRDQPKDDQSNHESNNNIVIRSSQPQRSRSKTQTQQQQQRSLSSSSGSRNTTIVAKKRPTSVHPSQLQRSKSGSTAKSATTTTTTTTTTKEEISTTAALADIFSNPNLFSNINNNTICHPVTDPMIPQIQPQLPTQQQQGVVVMMSSNTTSQMATNTNPFSNLHDTNPFKTLVTSTNNPITAGTTTNISQPVRLNYNPFLTPEGLSDNIPISNVQAHTNFNPFL